jgi:hypothetical protein
MVNWKAIGIALLIIGGGFVVLKLLWPYIIPAVLGVPAPTLPPLIFPLLTCAAILIGISGLLPSRWANWSRRLVKAALILVFVGVLLIELPLISSAHHRVEVSMEECKNFFIPVTNVAETSTLAVDAIKYASCVLTGYFPTTTQASEVGWVTFYIFYIILPFAFIFAFMYGLMSGLGFESLFGAVTKPVVTVLTFVISMYATRVLFGAVLLELLGYGAWALAAVFIAIIITGGLWKLMSGLYPVVTPLLEGPALARAEWIIGRLTNPETFRVLSEKEKKDLEKELEQLAANYPSVRAKVEEVSRKAKGERPAPSSQ